MAAKQPHLHRFFPGDTSESSDSDTISNVTVTRRCACLRMFPERLAVELDPNDKGVYEVIRRRFLICLGSVGDRTNVVAIHRRNWSEVSSQAKLRSFESYARLSQVKNDGSGNVKFGWFGSCKERVEKIMSHGFSHLDVQTNVNGAVYLSPDDFPIDSVQGAVPDEGGVRHVLLCRIILGKSELLRFGSGQTHPSSEAFDSGMDDLNHPRKYIVWSTHMNTHILPEFIVSFKVTPPPTSSSNCSATMENWMNMQRPISPWISFQELFTALSKVMSKKDVYLLNKYHNEFKDRKINRKELIHKVRRLAGDELLANVIKSSREAKETKTSIGLMHKRTNQE